MEKSRQFNQEQKLVILESVQEVGIPGGTVLTRLTKFTGFYAKSARRQKSPLPQTSANIRQRNPELLYQFKHKIEGNSPYPGSFHVRYLDSNVLHRVMSFV